MGVIKRGISGCETEAITDFLIKEALQQREWYLKGQGWCTRLEVEESLERFEQKLVEGVNEILTETKG